MNSRGVLHVLAAAAVASAGTALAFALFKYPPRHTIPIAKEVSSVRRVRETTWRVLSEAEHVTVDDSKVEEEVERMLKDRSGEVWPPPDWDCGDYHFNDGGPQTVQYLLVLDGASCSLCGVACGKGGFTQG